MMKIIVIKDLKKFIKKKMILKIHLLEKKEICKNMIKQWDLSQKMILLII